MQTDIAKFYLDETTEDGLPLCLIIYKDIIINKIAEDDIDEYVNKINSKAITEGYLESMSSFSIIFPSEVGEVSSEINSKGVSIELPGYPGVSIPDFNSLEEKNKFITNYSSILENQGFYKEKGKAPRVSGSIFIFIISLILAVTFSLIGKYAFSIAYYANIIPAILALWGLKRLILPNDCIYIKKLKLEHI
ncbi:hypothetical protein FHU10_1815 [Serratia fonticola]|uniref:Uncharacterized protein n=1 Tax=Serratia fonticola TaxID=47917 RepID=A0A542CVH2_SERFO|nr:hypothetical protein [Serratia fonticola]TQI78187.1 hypothetical protein FHU09_0636 [Serratia fonticola]TQI94815.1 hypothetical protein FHU11_0156 [Serratia fonticola]TVZ69313.1 hypothetical protein FHU10_1815 [Serratia fonticola]